MLSTYVRFKEEEVVCLTKRGRPCWVHCSVFCFFVFFFSVKLPVWGLILTALHMKWEKQSELFLRDRPEAFLFHFASSSAASCFSVHQKLVPCPCKVWQGRIVPLQTLQRRVAQASPPQLCRGTAFLQSSLHQRCSRKYTVQPTLGLQSKAPHEAFVCTVF